MIEKASRRPLALRAAAVSMFAISLVVNGLAGTKVLGGNTTAEVSDAYPNLFAPAGITFAIWGVIYTLLTIFCIRMFWRGGQSDAAATEKLIDASAKDFLVLSGLNAAWLFAWQYRVLWLSVLLIIAMLIMLIRVTARAEGQALTTRNWLAVKLPFSVYFGWITIATIANITAWLVSIRWSGWGIGEETWTIIMLVVGALIGVATAWRRQDWPYLAVFVWAYGGIWLKHTSATGHNHAYDTVISLLTVLVPVFVLLTAWFLYRWPKGVTGK